MKKLSALILALAMGLSFASCGSEEAPEEAPKEEIEVSAEAAPEESEVPEEKAETAKFQELGITFSEKETDYPFISKTKDADLDTEGKVNLFESFTTDGDTFHYNDKENYEIKVGGIHYTFYDENAQEYGYTFGAGVKDFYTGESLETGSEVEVDGVMYPVEINYYDEPTEWIDGVCVKYLEISAVVPKGYDGAVFYVFDARNDGLQLNEMAKAESTYFWKA